MCSYYKVIDSFIEGLRAFVGGGLVGVPVRVSVASRNCNSNDICNDILQTGQRTDAILVLRPWPQTSCLALGSWHLAIGIYRYGHFTDALCALRIETSSTRDP